MLGEDVGSPIFIFFKSLSMLSLSRSLLSAQGYPVISYATATRLNLVARVELDFFTSPNNVLPVVIMFSFFVTKETVRCEP